MRGSRRPSTAGSIGSVLCVLSCALTSCSGKPNDAAASAEPVLSSSAAPAPSASAVRAIEAPPPEPPTLRPVLALAKERETEKDLAGHESLFTVPGAVLLATTNRVGRLTTSGIEWKGSLDAPDLPFGPAIIQWAGGSYPDHIDIMWSFSNGRAAQPTYSPLTGKAASVTFAPGGGGGWIHGVARVGATVLVSGYDMSRGQRIEGAAGPAVTRLSVPWALKCGDKKPGFGGMDADTQKGTPAVRPVAYGGIAFAATPAGTLFSYGVLCDDEAAVEVWSKDGGQPRIFELGEWIKPETGGLLLGRDDDAWITSDPILAWKGDRFEPLPRLPGPVVDAFVSTKGELHVSDGTSIHRWDGTRFVQVARLVWPADYGFVAVDEGVFWATLGGKVHRLEKGEPAATGEACKTPFVYLYEVSYKSEPKYTFPTTRKALASFASLEGVQLVDFEAGSRRLGAIVPSWDVGAKLVAHVELNMKEERPRLVCFKPEKARTIPIDGGK